MRQLNHDQAESFRLRPAMPVNFENTQNHSVILK